MWVWRAAIPLLVAALAMGCGGYVGSAKRAYEDGRYLEAAEKLDPHQGDINNLPPRRQADFGIYFGLSLFMLGDYGGAHRWLSFAAAVEAHRPGTLTIEQRNDLHRGFWQLSQAAAGPPPPPPGFVPPAPQTLVVPAPAPADSL